MRSDSHACDPALLYQVQATPVRNWLASILPDQPFHDTNSSSPVRAAEDRVVAKRTSLARVDLMVVVSTRKPAVESCAKQETVELLDDSDSLQTIFRSQRFLIHEFEVMKGGCETTPKASS